MGLLLKIVCEGGCEEYRSFTMQKDAEGYAECRQRREKRRKSAGGGDKEMWLVERDEETRTYVPLKKLFPG